MLACARIGAVHSVVFGGFAAKELATRIDDATPVVLVTASGGLEPGRTVEYLPIVEQAIGLSPTPPHTVIVKNREQIPVRRPTTRRPRRRGSTGTSCAPTRPPPSP